MKHSFSQMVLAIGVVLGLALNQGQALGGTLPPGVTIFATELGNQELVSVTGSTVSNIAAATQPDSLIFANGGIAYTNVNTGGVSFYNSTTTGGTTTLLANGLSIPQDIALIPSGFNANAGQVLVSDTGQGKIISVNLSGPLNSYTTFASPGNPTGLAFDNANHLFAINGTSLLEYNGAGTQIGSVALPHAGDGLTYDPVTGELWASYVGGIMEIPTSLASVKDVPYNGDRIDGIESDGAGSIYMADTATSNIVQYSIAANTFTQETNVPTIDDLAPLVGPGSSTPEPATITLLGIGAAGMMGYGWRRRKQARLQ